MTTNLTTPRAILIGSFVIASAVLFRIDGVSLLIADANADVAGMDHPELRRDRTLTANCVVYSDLSKQDYSALSAVLMLLKTNAWPECSMFCNSRSRNSRN